MVISLSRLQDALRLARRKMLRQSGESRGGAFPFPSQLGRHRFSALPKASSRVMPKPPTILPTSPSGSWRSPNSSIELSMTGESKWFANACASSKALLAMTLYGFMPG